MNRDQRLVIIGGGPAGLSTAEAYRESGGRASVVMLAAEDSPPYQRPPLTKEYLRGALGREDLPMRPAEWFEDNDVELRLATPAEAIDTARRIVRTGSGELAYDACVIATGSEPIRLPVPGGDDPEILTMRTVCDSTRLRERVVSGSRAVVVGSGFIGCEAAASLSMRGARVTLVSMEEAPQKERLGEEVGERIRSWLREYGVDLRLGVSVEGIERRSGGFAVGVGGQDEAVEADVVLFGTGVKARVGLAEQAGLKTRDGGVVCDSSMRTSEPGVFAVGDRRHLRGGAGEDRARGSPARMTLPAPDSALRVCVVVPARDEEALISSCLEALAAQKDIAPEEYEVLLVLDRCEDATEARAREFVRAHPSLRLRFLKGPGRGAGHARRVGMEAACERLHSLGRAEGLISSTDADTVVSPDWLAAQIEAASRGAQAIGGRIELRDTDLPEGVSDWRAEQGHLRHLDLLSDLSSDETGGSNTEHWQFSGASLALTAAVYKDIGGLEPRAALEDEYLERVLRQRRIPIKRPLDVRVKTSARLVGRASRGLARDLALATWFRRNSFSAGDFTPSGLRSRKRGEISAVVPLDDRYDEEAIDSFLALKESGLVDELVVVHGGERKVSLPSEMVVHDASVLVPGYGAVRGRGDLLWRALHVVRGDIVVFADPSIPDPAGRIPGLIGPLIENQDLEMVRGYSGDTEPDTLTNILARPLINLHYPELAGFAAPLSRELAARKSLLQAMPFPVGDGVDISLLLDAARLAGVNALAQSDLGPLPHRIGDRDPTERAYALLAAAGTRLPGSGSAEELAPGPLFVPSPAGLVLQRVAVEERPPMNGREALAPDAEEPVR